MDGLEKEYYNELKKNQLLQLKYNIITKIKEKNKEQNIDFSYIKSKALVIVEDVKKNIKKWGISGNESYIYKTLEKLMNLNINIDTSFFAFNKNVYKGNKGILFNEDYVLYSPLVYRENDRIKKYSITDYDYTSGYWEWWDVPYESKKNYMSKPFLSGVLGKDEVILQEFPIIVNDIYYGIIGYQFEFQKLNKICSYL
jgi:hypothetical protein